LIASLKAKIFRSIDLREVIEVSGIKSEEEVKNRVEDSLKKEGYHVEYQ
jgi:hypothetical protein